MRLCLQGDHISLHGDLVIFFSHHTHFEFVNKKINGVPYGHSWGACNWGAAAEVDAIRQQRLKRMQSGTTANRLFHIVFSIIGYL